MTLSQHYPLALLQSCLRQTLEILRHSLLLTAVALQSLREPMHYLEWLLLYGLLYIDSRLWVI